MSSHASRETFRERQRRRRRRWVCRNDACNKTGGRARCLNCWTDVLTPPPPLSHAFPTRFSQARLDRPWKSWKLSPMDLESRSRWDEYTLARDEMFKRTSGPVEWAVVPSNNKRVARSASCFLINDLYLDIADQPANLIRPLFCCRGLDPTLGHAGKIVARAAACPPQHTVMRASRGC